MNNNVTCSFSMDRETYNNYKSIVSRKGENVKGNLIKYMNDVIRYNTPNAETIRAFKEADELIKNPNRKSYDSFAEMMEDIHGEI